MTNFQKHLFIIFVVGGAIITGAAFALTKDDIVFPVAELESCQNEQECRAYCDDPANITQCVAFAEKYNLLSEGEIEKAKKFQDIGAVGPGGCRAERECRAYCENIENIEECLAFAAQHGFMQGSELQKAKKIAQALREGTRLPGGCTGKAACETYCSDSSHMKECVEFAEKAGFMSPEELKEAKQVLKALDAGVSFPGNCKGKNECEAYCEDQNHMEECVNFGIAAGFIPAEEAEQVRRVLPLMKEGKMPGQCRSKESCEAYCSDSSHIEECTTFFTQAGFMTQEEAQMFRKTGGKGPGDCRGRKQCEAFCNDPENQQACFEFGKEHGLISAEDLRNIEEGTRQMKEGIAMAPPEVAQCLREKIGAEVLQKIEAGTFVPNRQIGETMRSCFELQQQIMESKMRECLSKSCEEFFACLDSVGQAGPRGGEPAEGERPEGREGQGGFSAVQQEIEAKIGSCVQQFQPQEGQQFPGGSEFPGGFPREFGPSQEFREGSLPPEFEGKSPEEIEQIFREQEGQRVRQQFQQEFERQFQEQQNMQPFIPQNDSRAAACAGEGGVWDGSACRPAGTSGEFFPETGPSQDQQTIQQTQEQTQRQLQRQQLEQQIQEQQQQLQQQMQLLQQQTAPTQPPTATGGNILDAAGNLLKRFLGR